MTEKQFSELLDRVTTIKRLQDRMMFGVEVLAGLLAEDIRLRTGTAPNLGMVAVQGKNAVDTAIGIPR